MLWVVGVLEKGCPPQHNLTVVVAADVNLSSFHTCKADSCGHTPRRCSASDARHLASHGCFSARLQGLEAALLYFATFAGLYTAEELPCSPARADIIDKVG